MWPWGHLAVGYLLYTIYVHVRRREPPSGPGALLVALGTQAPDLVDKPLAWTFHVLPSGRSLAHSLFAAAIATALVRQWATRTERPYAPVAFGIGYFSHLATDGIDPLLAGDYAKLTYLGWPLLPAPDYGVESGFVAHFANITLTPTIGVQLLLMVLVVGIWVRDGAPGVRTVQYTGAWLYDRVTAGR